MYICTHIYSFSLMLSRSRICLQCRIHRRCSFHPWVGKIPWRRKWQPTPVFLPGKSYGQRSQAGYGPWGHTGVGHDLVTKQQKQQRNGLNIDKPHVLLLLFFTFLLVCTSTFWHNPSHCVRPWEFPVSLSWGFQVSLPCEGRTIWGCMPHPG